MVTREARLDLLPRKVRGKLNAWRRQSGAWWRSWTGDRGPGVRVVANGLPKAGTHLLRRSLDLMPGIDNSGWQINGHSMSSVMMERIVDRVRAGYYIWGHVPHDRAVADMLRRYLVQMIVIVRDPRDVAVSHFQFVDRTYKQHHLHTYYRKLPDDSARLMTSISGLPATAEHRIGLDSIRTKYTRYLAWQEEGALIVRFEDLIGAAGGGDDDRQSAAVAAIADHLQLPLEQSQLAAVAQSVFHRGSNTFRRGVIGEWPRQFSDHHRAEMKLQAGDILIQLGYESNESW